MKANIKWSLLSNFPALKYCRLTSNDPNAIQSITLACKELVCLCYEFNQAWLPLSLLSINHHKLQQLCIEALDTVVPDIFMDTISANGQLECVVISVSSLTIEGSPGLLTLIVITRDCVYNGKRVRVDSKDTMD